MTSKSLFTFPSKFSFFYIQRFDAFFSPTLWKQHTLSQPVRGWVARSDRTTNIRLWTVWPMALIICNASVVSKSIVISVLSTGKSNMQNKNLFAIRNYYQAIINNQPVTLLHNFQTSFFMCTSEIIYKTRSKTILDNHNNNGVLQLFISHLLSHKITNYFDTLNQVKGRWEYFISNWEGAESETTHSDQVDPLTPMLLYQ